MYTHTHGVHITHLLHIAQGTVGAHHQAVLVPYTGQHLQALLASVEFIAPLVVTYVYIHDLCVYSKVHFATK